MKISIIIPILNEEKNIVNTVDMLDRLKGDKEVIFVDGGSVDNTTNLIPPYYKVVRSGKGRALQMNIGAKHAAGDVLLFLHCDSILDSNALYPVISEVIDKGYTGGCYSLRFDDGSCLLSIIAFLSNMRVRFFRIMFGDQGIFVKKDVFEQIGGYPDIPIMEDIEFSIKLKKAGGIKQIKSYIITSSRRFKDNGILKTIMFMHKLKVFYILGKSPDDLRKMYRDVR